MLKKTTLDDLARMVKLGFDETTSNMNHRFEQVDKRFEQVDKRFEQVDKRFEQVDKRFERLETRMEDGFNNVNSRLSVIESDVAEIRRHFVYRDEFEDALARISLLEKKLGIKSGK